MVCVLAFPTSIALQKMQSECAIVAALRLFCVKLVESRETMPRLFGISPNLNLMSDDSSDLTHHFAPPNSMHSKQSGTPMPSQRLCLIAVFKLINSACS